VIVAVLVAAFIATGSCGQATLEHWDEDALVAKVRASVVNRGTLLPDSYDWPSVSYWIALAALVPDITAGPPPTRGSISAVEGYLVEALDSPAYRLRVRRAFLVVSSLSTVWVYLTVIALGRGGWIALLGAALVATSWEIAYHARWPAPDGPMMQWAALSLFGAACALRRDDHPGRGGSNSRTNTMAWRLSAAAAGAAVGTKYSAWPLVVMLMAARARRRSAREVMEIGVVAVAAFLITTPGALFQPVQFLDGLQFQWSHYTTGHGQHSIAPGWPHLMAELHYLGTALWSPWMAPAIAVAVLAIPGAVDLARRQRPAAILVVGFPVAYVCYLAVHRVFVVRNLIVTAPFLAVLTAWGAAAWPRLDSPQERESSCGSSLGCRDSGRRCVVGHGREKQSRCSVNGPRCRRSPTRGTALCNSVSRDSTRERSGGPTA
jgi:hypothetical protein